mmetsp:Transcript_96889/g.216866  ORF Transcript_96889/g.216866 Transcript_96889/m.216866 type:complete len:263 (-) Transcript_96889:1074-1862(-)
MFAHGAMSLDLLLELSLVLAGEVGGVVLLHRLIKKRLRRILERVALLADGGSGSGASRRCIAAAAWYPSGPAGTYGEAALLLRKAPFEEGLPAFGIVHIEADPGNTVLRVPLARVLEVGPDIIGTKEHMHTLDRDQRCRPQIFRLHWRRWLTRLRWLCRLPLPSATESPLRCRAMGHEITVTGDWVPELAMQGLVVTPEHHGRLALGQDVAEHDIGLDVVVSVAGDLLLPVAVYVVEVVAEKHCMLLPIPASDVQELLVATP